MDTYVVNTPNKHAILIVGSMYAAIHLLSQATYIKRNDCRIFLPRHPLYI